MGAGDRFLDQPVHALPTPAARLAANLQNPGHNGGHDLHYRTLKAAGVTLVGRFIGADERRATFADDLAACVRGDDRHREFMALVRRTCEERGIRAPDIVEPAPFKETRPPRSTCPGLGR